MSSIIETLGNWQSGFKFRNLSFGIDPGFQVLKTVNSLGAEHKEWAILHGGFDQFEWNGKGQRIAILDTGVDVNHVDLSGQVEEFNFILNQKNNSVLTNHGTFCAGEVVAKADGKGIVGVAPKATCFSGRVLYGDNRDRSLSKFEQALSNAIMASVTEGCGVISMSLGTPHASPLVRDSLEYAVNNGVIPFAAAGNEGMEGSPYASYPASFEDCISIAATNEKDLPSWFSTEGIQGNDKQQPEMAISSLEFYWGCYPDNKYSLNQGTSMACPMAAGVALLWREAMQSKGTMPTGRNVLNEFRKWIRKVTNDTNKNGWDAAMGWGVLLLEDDEL